MVQFPQQLELVWARPANLVMLAATAPLKIYGFIYGDIGYFELRFDKGIYMASGYIVVFFRDFWGFLKCVEGVCVWFCS